jgi:hypothetical protein
MTETPKNKMNHRGPYPRYARKGESIGGGHIVFRRDPETGRVVTPVCPFEYANENDAINQAKALADANPGVKFDVWGVSCRIAAIVVPEGEGG